LVCDSVASFVGASALCCLVGCIGVIRNSRHEGWIIGYFIIRSISYRVVV